jgi:hypothetical protein
LLHSEVTPNVQRSNEVLQNSAGSYRTATAVEAVGSSRHPHVPIGHGGSCPAHPVVRDRALRSSRSSRIEVEAWPGAVISIQCQTTPRASGVCAIALDRQL